MDLYDFPMTYRGLTLNEHRTTAGALDTAKETDTTRVDRLDFGRVQQRDQREPLHVIPGGDLGDATLAFRYISIAGMLRASTGAKLSDRIASVLTAFHVEEAQRDSTTTEGVTAFTYYDVTEVTTVPGSTAVGDGTYYFKERLMGRPAGYPVISGRRSGGDAVPFAAEVVCPDTRRYCDTQTTVTLNSGNSWSATCANWNSTQGIATSPVITITMTGAGASNFSIDIASDGASALVLDLSGTVNTDSVTVDMATGVIKKNGSYSSAIRTSSLLTLFGYVPGGGATATASNTTNVSSVVLTYRQARG